MICKYISQAMISIHTPLARSDLRVLVAGFSHDAFQSTLPLRGVTHIRHQFQRPDRISIHTPLARSDQTVRAIGDAMGISIHTPLARSDFAIFCHASRSPKFQSTLPLRGVTSNISDTGLSAFLFQSTLPLRGVTQPQRRRVGHHRFQSTLPLRGVTGDFLASSGLW